MKKRIFSILLALVLIGISVLPAYASVGTWAGTPDVGTTTDAAPGASHNGSLSAQGGTTVGLLTSRGEYALVIVKEKGTENLLAGAKVTMHAYNSGVSPENRTISATTDTKGSALLQPVVINSGTPENSLGTGLSGHYLWGQSYYFYAELAGYSYNASTSATGYSVPEKVTGQIRVPENEPHTIILYMDKLPATQKTVNKVITIKDSAGASGKTISGAMLNISYADPTRGDIFNRYFSDANGVIRFTQLCGIAYTYSVGKTPEYPTVPATGTLQLDIATYSENAIPQSENGKEISQTIYLQNTLPNTLNFTVKNVAAQGIASAQITVWETDTSGNKTGTAVGTGSTDANGNASVGVLNYNTDITYYYETVASGFVTMTGKATPSALGSNPVAVTLTRSNSYTPRVPGYSGSEASPPTPPPTAPSEPPKNEIGIPGGDGIMNTNDDIRIIPNGAPTPSYDENENGIALPIGGEVVRTTIPNKGDIIIGVPPGTSVTKPTGNIVLPNGNQQTTIQLPGSDERSRTADDPIVTPGLDGNGKNNSTIDADGTITVPDGGDIVYPISSGRGVISVRMPEGTKINPDGTLDLPDGNEQTEVTLPGPDGELGNRDDINVTPGLDGSGKNNSTIDSDGTVTVPDGGDIVYPINPGRGGISVRMPKGTKIKPDGTLDLPDGNEQTEVTLPGPDGELRSSDDIIVTPGLDGNGRNNTTIDADGTITMPDGGEIVYPINPGDGDISVKLPEGTKINPDGTYELPDGNEQIEVTLPGPDDELGNRNDVIVIPNLDEDGHNNAVLHPEGSTELPNGGIYLADGGSVFIDGERIAVPAGTTVLSDGTIIYPSGEVVNNEISFHDCTRHPRMTWEAVPMLWMVSRFFIQRRRFKDME